MNRSEQISATAELLRGASRPLFVWGAGMRPSRKPCLALARSLGVPVACTWGAIDLVHHDDELYVGGFGTHGTRAANLAIQNSDFLITLGTRLDTKSTGTPADFARAAKICMVDIDAAEIGKFEKLGRQIDVGICMDAGKFVEAFWHACQDLPHYADWIEQISQWKKSYVPTGPAYDLMRRISEYTTKDDIIVSDTGNTLGWIMQGFPFKGEWFIHAFNFTPMGYGLAAAVGAAFAGGSRVVCIVGDGGALMSVNELATIARHKLNIKIILLNNKGHAMCRHTQRQWLGGKYPATSIEGGLGFPDWTKCAQSFDIRTYDEIGQMFYANLISDPSDWGWPGFCEVMIDPDESLAFQVKYGEPIA